MIKRIFATALLLSVGCIAVAQQLFDSLLTVLNTKYPQEKIHLHLDRNFYNPGETVWFKGYVLNEMMPSSISKTMYADLLDEKGKVVSHKTMPVILGGGASDFILPSKISSGKYAIRAYTDWMLNFDSSLIPLTPVNIILPGAARAVADKKYSLTLFPEGGDMVNNIPGRIAFKTNDETGKPFEVSGKITDAAGKDISNFNTSHRGMGIINLTPLPGETYTLQWKDPAGMAHTTPLPAAKNVGAGFNLRATRQVTYYSITRPEDAPEAFKEFYVIGQINQQICYGARINLAAKTTVTAPIATDSLPDGIMQVTLFNKNSEPVAERVVFINNKTFNFITDLHLPEKNITAKGKNMLQVDVGGNLQSNLSVSVTDATLDVKSGPQENILTDLLLSQDLRGGIYDPVYYFTSDEDSLRQQLDMVMMTNGWRRFNWSEVLAGRFPTIRHKPHNYLAIEGNVFGLNKGQLLGKSLTGVLQSSDKGARSFISIPINADGSFLVDGLYFFDTVKLFYQFNNDKNKNLTNAASYNFTNGLAKPPVVNIAKLSSLHFAPPPPEDIALKSIRQSDLYVDQLNQQKIKVLETVTVTGKAISKEEQFNKDYASGLFSGGQARTFITEDDPFANSAMSILDYLRGKVPGLQIDSYGMTGGSITRRGSPTATFLNEMNTDIAMLQSTPMTDVAMIKVFDPPFMGAPGGGAGGAVAVYTKKGASANANVQGLNVATLYGYSELKEFYQPDYETGSSSLPDYRTTLYWNPFLLMDAKNKRVMIPFYNNDSAKKIRVVVEGINEAGQLTREEKIFE